MPPVNFQRIHAALAITAVLLLAGCASPVPPYGGPKDEQPPVVIEDESTLNPTLNYAGEQIEIVFDEWVELNKPGQQIIISPPMNRKPQFTLRGKSLLVEMDDEEVLQRNTTYTINFGEAIQDITERNPLKNFTFVFSTGSYVDSLALSAAVTDARTEEPVSDVLVVLYEHFDDTTFQRSIPSYFGSTEEGGSANLRYLRNDTFYVLALEDGNGNFRFDQPTERIGFVPDPVVLDTAIPSFQIRLFENKPELYVLDVDQAYGSVKVAMSRPVDSLLARRLDGTLLERIHVKEDTFYLWHTSPDTFDVALGENATFFDTIQIRPYRPSTNRYARLEIGRAIRHPDSAIVLRSPHPLTLLDTSRMRLMLGDSARQEILSAEAGPDERTARLNSEWVPGGRYQLYLDPGAIQNMFGEDNDSLRIAFSFAQPEDFVLVELELSGFDPGYSYVMQLRNSGGVFEEAVIPAGEDSTMLRYKAVPIAEYEVRLIQDENGNGRWDTGSLEERKQPEHMYIQPLGEMRAGWDLNTTVIWPER